MKNVLMIAYTEYPQDARVRREAEALARTGRYRVEVLVLKTGNRPQTLDMVGVRVIEVDQKKYAGQSKLRYIGAYLEFLVRCFGRCTQLFLKGQADIIHVHNMPDFLVCAALVPRVFRRKLILDVHDSMPETYLSKFAAGNSLPFQLLRLEECSSAAAADRVICVNQVQREALVGHGIREDKITIVMNVPDPTLFPVDGTPQPRRETGEGFRMVYHGTIAERLGVDLAVRALAELAPAIPGLEFHVWSKAGPALDAIEELGRSLKVGQRLHLRRGGVPLQRLAEELKTMTLGVVCNRKGIATEMMLPVKMLEYIALGIPVVAPRLKCIRHYFSEDMLSFFEPGSVTSLASAILALYRDPGRGAEQARRARAFLDRYGWGEHQHDLIRMYDGLYSN